MVGKEISDRHKTLLYRIALRQDEQGRQSTLLRVNDLGKHKFYQDLLELGYLTYETVGNGDNAIARMIVTMKGERYCQQNLEELSRLDKANWGEVWYSRATKNDIAG